MACTPNTDAIQTIANIRSLITKLKIYAKLYNYDNYGKWKKKEISSSNLALITETSKSTVF